MDNTRRTPGIPGLIGDLQWVDSPDFGDAPEDRRIPRVYDVDPAPLARMIAAYLQLTDESVTEVMREIAGDDRDGPIHIVHLLGACERAAKATGGGLPGAANPLGHGTAGLISMAISGEALPALVEALRCGGFPAATGLVRALDSEARYYILDSLIEYWGAPIVGLQIDLTDDKLRRSKP
ncbi:hypothetical protein [Actinomadura kijaniata]|uniref:hypothetical protein n=1 Tax=Actinomadura kijaniata TaxID=46161 RepID=UPI00082BE933|nr:hypothetical protein [Actinomadura kijaniata]